MNASLHIALVGNPNSGKSSLFNALTGLHQKVGNFPGVTVDKKTGKMNIGDYPTTLIDLPGTYSFYPKREDEWVAYKVLMGVDSEVKTDVILLIADASNLKRNLLFCSQIIDLKIPVVLALTMNDLAAKKGIKIDIAGLQEDLGIPVVAVDARKNKGLQELKAALNTIIQTPRAKNVESFIDNKALADKLIKYNLPAKEFFELTTEKGNKLNAWMIKPKDFDANKKYPVFMYQYSGPGSQQVDNKWNTANDYWFMMLSQLGYITVCVDGRGTGFKGAAFKKVTQKQLGKLEVEDQIDAAKVIGNYSYVDKSRIGIFGWSYGGFMSSNCLFKGDEVFKMAIAVAPVTNWRFYDSIYTERYLQTPQENASGYDNNSPINHVSKLKGNFLLVHGTADDNVHIQNTMKMVEALVQANKQFDWAIYPDKNHGIYGGKTRLQLYTKMTNFIKEKL